MVSLRRGLWLGLLLLAAGPSWGQYYATDDTVTEYPNKGTFYHNRFHGRKTASGEVFDQNKFTAAHWKIKLGTLIMVTNHNTGRQVIVKVNDRCPKRGVIDMTRRAAASLGIRGCQDVTLRILPPGYEQRWAAQDSTVDSVTISPTPKPKPATPKQAPAVPKKSGANATVTAHTGQYNLVLGTVKTHGEAFTKIQQLPEAYQPYTLVDQLPGGGGLLLTLDLQLSKKQATALSNQLRRQFPDVKVVQSE